MSCTQEPRYQRQILAHFAGRSRAQDEVEWRAHMETCARCRAFYSQQQLLERLSDPAGARQQRIARSLGLRWTAHRPFRFVQWGGLAVAAAAAAVLVFYVAAGFEVDEAGEAFVARGEGSLSSTLLAYRIDADGGATRLRAGMTVAASDRFAFAYKNINEYKYLMVFGGDNTGRVYWFHPAWNDATQDPSSVPILAGGAKRELPEAISHSVAGSFLSLYGVFTQQPLSVRAVELWYAETHANAQRLPVPGVVSAIPDLRLKRAP